MCVMATAVQGGSASQVQATRRVETPEPAAGRESTAAWGYLTHPALMPTVFASSGSAPENHAPEDVAERKV